ncbi:MAG: hypothetical protein OEV42_18090 [Deltaproteobacteria bacterium]|nr:hypothetical protein [Deltaproteobacteria bacterium]
MPYSHIRYIGYHVPTIAKNAKKEAIYGIPAGGLPDLSEFSNNTLGLVDAKALKDKKPKDHVALKGESSSLELVKKDTDLLSRLQRLFIAMECAAHELEKDTSKGVLNVFMAPEFYLRPHKEPNSYSKKYYQAIQEVLSKTIAANPKLSDWLIIPGTVMWSREEACENPSSVSQSMRNVLTRKIGTTNFFVDHNTAFVLSGPNNALVSSDRKVEKFHVASADGIPSLRPKIGNEVNGVERTNRTDLLTKHYKINQSVDDHVFTHGGVKFGLEICADHQYSLLKQKHSITGDFTSQLLVACGQEIQIGAVVTKPGGTIFRCDGKFSVRHQADKRNVISYQKEPVNAVLEPDSTSLGTDRPVTIYKEIIFDSKHPCYWAKPSSADQTFWGKYKQGITIFKKEKLVK